MPAGGRGEIAVAVARGEHFGGRVAISVPITLTLSDWQDRVVTVLQIFDGKVGGGPGGDAAPRVVRCGHQGSAAHCGSTSAAAARVQRLVEFNPRQQATRE